MKKKQTISGPKPLIKEFLRKMKLTILLVTFTVLYSFATDSYAQVARLSVNMENSTIKSVLREIENQSEFRFFYSGEVNVENTVSVSMNNKNVMETLDEVFAGTGIRYEIYGRQIALLASQETDLPAGIQSVQQAGLTGKVIDNTGAPLPGVSVVFKGTTQGTTTDVNGNYTLSNVPSGATLLFSFVGMRSQEIVVGSQTVINVTMEEETIGIEEVVAVGYGVQKKETLSGAITSIKSEDITTTKSENLVNNIQGKVTGLLVRQRTGEPGTFDNLVSIRGYGAPLIVIDGITRDGISDFAQLNSDDVESISILKDASAAIYGMNAANGVIIVTTKKGTPGKAKFSYSGLFGVKGATGLEYTVDAYTYRLMANEMQRNIGAAPTYSEEILEKYRTNQPGYVDNNWIGMFMSDWVFQQQQNLSIRGGSEKVKYFTSFGYTEDNGLLKSGIQYYKRFNFRQTTTAELTKDLTLNVSASGRLDNTQSPREDFLWTFKTIMVNDRGIGPHTIANDNHLSVIAPENKNAFALVDPDIDGYRRSGNIQYQSTVDLSYKVPFVKGLTVSAVGAFDGNIRNYSILQKSYKLYDYYTDDYVTTTGTNSYRNDLTLDQRVHARVQANYTKSWAQKHNLNVTAVAEMTSTRRDYLMGSRQYLDLYTHDIIDQGTSTTAANSGNRRYTKLAAYLGRVNYDFAGKYLLEIVARYDGSYRYAPSKRWVFFPSFSAGWRISEEEFIKDKMPYLSNLKLRVSYGESGIDAGNAFEYIAGYTGATASGYVFSDNALTIGMVAPGVVNDNLSWITSKTSNIGLDFDFWKGKIGGTVEVFSRENSGLLDTRIQSVPNTFGATFPQENINSEMNKGIEFMLSHRGKIGADFNYSVSANVTYARLKTLHDERAAFTSSWDEWKNSNEDRYTGRMWLYEYDGRYSSMEEYETAPLMGGTQGNSKMLPGSFALTDINGDGIINSSDQTDDHWNFGNLNPPIQYGLTLAADYKSFDVNILFQGASGYSINYRNNDIWGYGRYPTLHEKFMDRWHVANATDDPYNPATQWVSGYYPALRSNTSNTTDQNVIDVWRPDATYLRLKSIELGYNLPKQLVQKMKFGSVRVFANGFNLLTFCRRELKDADPERQERDWDANLTYPLMKSFNIGINVNL